MSREVCGSSQQLLFSESFIISTAKQVFIVLISFFQKLIHEKKFRRWDRFKKQCCPTLTMWRHLLNYPLIHLMVFSKDVSSKTIFFRSVGGVYRSGMSNVRPAGRMRPVKGLNAAREKIFLYVMHVARERI